MNLKLYAATAALAAACLSLGISGHAAAAEKATKSTKTTKTTKSTTTAKPAAAQPAANAPQNNAIAQAMAKAGVSKCLPRINQFTNFLTANAQTGVMLFVDPAAPDPLINSVSMEIQAPKALTYVSATFAPDEVGNGCGGMYEAVTHWNNSCNDVAAKAFANFKPAKPLRQAIATLEGGPQVRVFLMPTAQGCISVKKEVVF